MFRIRLPSWVRRSVPVEPEGPAARVAPSGESAPVFTFAFVGWLQSRAPSEKRQSRICGPPPEPINVPSLETQIDSAKAFGIVRARSYPGTFQIWMSPIADTNAEPSGVNATPFDG